MAAIQWTAGASPGVASSPSSAPGATPSHPPVQVAVTVDWEGAYLSPAGLLATRGFFAKTAERVPLTHFLNAAYYTKPGADPAAVTRAIRSALHPDDVLALHLHGWRSLVRTAGVAFRTEPRFFGDRPLMEFEDDDVGFEVALNTYSKEEIERLIRTSRAILEAQGFRLLPGFRAAGGVADEGVLAAARAAGCDWDSSALPHVWLDEAPHLRALVRKAWPDLSPASEPHPKPTPAGLLVEVPISGGMVDYVSADEMVAHVRATLERSRRTGRRQFVVLGFHQENAEAFLPRLVEAIEVLRTQWPSQLEFTTLDRVVQTVREGLEPPPGKARKHPGGGAARPPAPEPERRGRKGQDGPTTGEARGMR